MPIAYIDSTILLSILFREASCEVAGALWEANPKRISSLLLSAECWTGMRRQFHRLGKRPPEGWMEERAGFLEGKLEEISIRPMDALTVARLKSLPMLAECRTLSALHLATALECRDRIGEDVVVVSFDRKMKETAIASGLAVLPA